MLSRLRLRSGGLVLVLVLVLILIRFHLFILLGCPRRKHLVQVTRASLFAGRFSSGGGGAYCRLRRCRSLVRIIMGCGNGLIDLDGSRHSNVVLVDLSAFQLIIALESGFVFVVFASAFA